MPSSFDIFQAANTHNLLQAVQQQLEQENQRNADLEKSNQEVQVRLEQQVSDVEAPPPTFPSFTRLYSSLKVLTHQEITQISNARMQTLVCTHQKIKEQIKFGALSVVSEEKQWSSGCRGQVMMWRRRWKKLNVDHII